MDWNKVGQVVKQGAPLLGTILGGPLGAAAGGVVSLVCSALGIKEETPDAVMAAIQGNPDAMLKLRELELANQSELAKLALQSDQSYLADRQSAREREIEIVKATGKRDINLYILAWMVVSCFFLLVGILMKINLPETNVGPINQLFGAMSTGFGMVLQYFFGSSRGSDTKTAIMAQQAGGK